MCRASSSIRHADAWKSSRASRRSLTAVVESHVTASCSANGTRLLAHACGDGEAGDGEANKQRPGRATLARRLVASSQRLGLTRNWMGIVSCESSFVDDGCETPRHSSCSVNGTRPAAHARGDGEAHSGTGVSDTSPAACCVEPAAQFDTQTDRNRLMRVVFC